MSKQKQAEAIALQARSIKQSRVARKMHDSLLQNFQGMMFRFQTARNLMTRHPDEALLSLNEANRRGSDGTRREPECDSGLKAGLQLTAHMQ
jgi:signal transduction histidine kinase